MLQDLKNKKLLLVGFEKTNRSFLKVLRKRFPEMKVGVADLNKNLEVPEDENLEAFLGENYLDEVGKFEIIVRSPGVPIVSELLEVEEKITTATQLFFEEVRGISKAKIIGITGTKGKSTTSTLTTEVLKAAGKKTFLLGNINVQDWDAIDEIDDESFIVYELSSYMLHEFKERPDIAIWLNIYNDHLSWHKGADLYLEAKANICLNQNEDDSCIYNAEIQRLADRVEMSEARKLKFNDDGGLHIDGGFIMDAEEKYIETSEIALKGRHNWENVLAVIAVAKILGIKKDVVCEVLRNFKALPHRLEMVGEVNGLKFVDDLLATNPEATIAALNSFEKVDCLILGGEDRGYEYEKLGKELCKRGVEHVILLPGCREKIEEALDDYQGDLYLVANIFEAVEIAADVVSGEGIVLLSPAAPSYDQFKNYEEKAAAFKKAIEGL